MLLLTLTCLTRATLTHLDSHGYEGRLASSPLSLVLFTANGCAACDTVYDILSDVQHDVPGTPIGVVNCFEEPKICDAANIFAVPKLVLTVGEDELVQYGDGYDKTRCVGILASMISCNGLT